MSHMLIEGGAILTKGMHNQKDEASVRFDKK